MFNVKMQILHYCLYELDDRRKEGSVLRNTMVQYISTQSNSNIVLDDGVLIVACHYNLQHVVITTKQLLYSAITYLVAC